MILILILQFIYFKSKKFIFIEVRFILFKNFIITQVISFHHYAI